MKLKPTKLQFAFAALAVALFFGLGFWDKTRLEKGKSAHFAYLELSGATSLIYDARIHMPDGYWSSFLKFSNKEMISAGGKVDFKWNYWTLGLASLFAFFIPKMFERIPSSESSREVKS